FRDAAMPGHHDDRVALVRRVPDVPGTIERDAVGALKLWVSDVDVAHAKGVCLERAVAPSRALQPALAVESRAPDRAARGVGDEEIAFVVERHTIRDQRLR